MRPPRSLAETVYNTMDSHGVPAERRSLGVYQQGAAPPVFGAHTMVANHSLRPTLSMPMQPVGPITASS